jgi:hypothetical protein
MSSSIDGGRPGIGVIAASLPDTVSSGGCPQLTDVQDKPVLAMARAGSTPFENLIKNQALLRQVRRGDLPAEDGVAVPFEVLA